MLAKKVAYNTLVQILGKVVGFFISGALLIVVAARLGTAGMGNYVTVLAFVGFFVTLADLGANLILVRNVSQNMEERVRITGEFLGFRLTFSLLILLLAPLVAYFVPQYSDLIIKGTVIITVSQFLLLVNQMFISMLQTQLMLDKAVMAELLNRIVTLCVVLYLVHAGLHGVTFYYGVLYATLIGALVNTTFTFIFARELWPIKPIINLASWKTTFAIIAPIGVFSFLGMVHFKADTIILSLIKSPSDVGIYGYAYKIGEIIFTFPVMFVGVVFPKLSQLLTSDKDKFNHVAQLAFDALTIGTLPFLTFIFLGAKYFTVVVARSNYADAIVAGQTLQVLVAAFFAWFIGTLFIHILIMADDYRGLIRNLSIAVGLNIVLNLILIPRYSYYGAAATTCITEFIMLFLTWRYMRSNIHFSPRFRFLGIALLGTVVMAVVISLTMRLTPLSLTHFAVTNHFIQMIWLVLLAGLAGATYLAVLLPLRGKQLLALVKGVQDAS